MDSDNFPGNLPPFGQLNASQRQFLIEHYRRCEAFWRNWTPTIWSLPSVAAAINVGAYTLLFGPGKDIKTPLQMFILGVLTLLNLALTTGFWKHRGMQRAFGERILNLEKYFGIPSIEFSTCQKKISGSLVYFVVMIIISLASLGLLICKATCCSEVMF